MADDLSYNNIDRPYNTFLNRDASFGSGILASNYSADGVSQDELAGGGVIKSGGSLSDITISNFIKSRSYQPKKQGFYIDARKGYIECMDLYAAGDITAIGGTIGGWTIGETTLTGGTITLDSTGYITGGTIRTAISGVRAQLTTGNDIELYEDTIGGGGTITGDVAEIRMIRLTQPSQYFTIRKRVGKDDTNDNVLEIFPSIPLTGKKNFMFIGRHGLPDSVTRNTSSINLDANIDTSLPIGANNGSILLTVAIDKVETNLSANLTITDARLFFPLEGQGVSAFLFGRGVGGKCGLAWWSPLGTLMGLYLDSTKLNLGIDLIPDADNAYDIGSGGPPQKRIKDIYSSGTIYSDGIIYATQINCSSFGGQGFANHIVPTSGGLNLGNAGYSWNTLYTNSIILSSANDYINFNATSGSSGYGIRDNGGTMQYKNIAGTWTDIGSGGGGSQTPWLSNINGGGYTLSNVGDISFSASDHYIKRGTDLHLKFTAANIESSRHFVSDISGAHTLGSVGQYWGRVYTIGVTIMGSGNVSDFTLGKLRIPVGTNLY